MAILYVCGAQHDVWIHLCIVQPLHRGSFGMYSLSRTNKGLRCVVIGLLISLA